LGFLFFCGLLQVAVPDYHGLIHGNKPRLPMPQPFQFRRAVLCATSALFLTCLFVSVASAQQNTDSTADKKPAAKASSTTHHTTTKSSTSSSSQTATGKKSSRRRKSTKLKGQQKIDPERARSIQEALIREHYLTGEPSGTWNQTSEDAMRKYQADHGWQSKTVPDSRALISLGLGPNHDHLLNPESAMTSSPVAHAASSVPTSQTPAPTSSTSAPTAAPSGPPNRQ
jgi:hypothetical protein